MIVKRTSPIALLAASLPWLLAGCGSPSSEDLLGEATLRYQEKDLVGAIDLAKQAKDIAEDEVTLGWASMVLGNFYSANSEYDAARDQFEEVLSAYGVENPNPILSKQARDACGNIVMGWVQISEPQKALDQALATSATLTRSSDFSLALSMMVIPVYSQLEKYEESLGEARRVMAASTDPALRDNANALVVDALIKQGRYDKAVATFLSFAKTYGDPQRWGDVLFRSSKIFPPEDENPDYAQSRIELVERAIAVYDSQLAETANIDAQSQILMQKASAVYELGHSALATDCLTSITTRLAVNPEIRGWAYVGLADFAFYEGEFQESLDAYNKVLQDFSQFPQIQQYAQSGVFQASQELAQRAVLGVGADSTDAADSTDTAQEPDAASQAPVDSAPAGAPGAKLDGSASPAADAQTPGSSPVDDLAPAVPERLRPPPSPRPER